MLACTVMKGPEMRSFGEGNRFSITWKKKNLKKTPTLSKPEGFTYLGKVYMKQKPVRAIELGCT